MMDTKEIFVCREHRIDFEKKLVREGYRVIDVSNAWEEQRCQFPKCCNKAHWYIRAIINYRASKKETENLQKFKNEQGIR